MAGEGTTEPLLKRRAEEDHSAASNAEYEKAYRAQQDLRAKSQRIEAEAASESQPAPAAAAPPPAAAKKKRLKKLGDRGRKKQKMDEKKQQDQPKKGMERFLKSGEGKKAGDLATQLAREHKVMDDVAVLDAIRDLFSRAGEFYAENLKFVPSGFDCLLHRILVLLYDRDHRGIKPKRGDIDMCCMMEPPHDKMNRIN